MVAGEIYWTDTELDVIQKANPDGNNLKIIIGDGLVAADGIIVDSTGRKVSFGQPSSTYESSYLLPSYY